MGDHQVNIAVSSAPRGVRLLLTPQAVAPFVIGRTPPPYRSADDAVLLGAPESLLMDVGSAAPLGEARVAFDLRDASGAWGAGGNAALLFWNGTCCDLPAEVTAGGTAFEFRGGSETPMMLLLTGRPSVEGDASTGALGWYGA